MKEIKIHGRGGQGAVTAAQLLATAAFNEGYWAQTFPQFELYWGRAMLTYSKKSR